MLAFKCLLIAIILVQGATVRITENFRRRWPIILLCFIAAVVLFIVPLKGGWFQNQEGINFTILAVGSCLAGGLFALLAGDSFNDLRGC